LKDTGFGIFVADKFTGVAGVITEIPKVIQDIAIGV